MSHYFGKKVKLDGYTFDSKKEAQFYLQFVKPSGMRFEIHPHYQLLDKFPLAGFWMRGLGYTPDFVIYNDDGSIAHVYDVKAGFTAYAVSTAARIRFVLFAYRYHIPVECVIVRKHDFKMKMFNFTKYDIQEAHAKKDKHGKVKRNKKTHKILYEYYGIYKTIHYDIADIIGC